MGRATSLFKYQKNKNRNKYGNIEKANICMIPIGFCMIPLFCLKVLVTAQGCILEKVDIYEFLGNGSDSGKIARGFPYSEQSDV